MAVNFVGVDKLKPSELRQLRLLVDISVKQLRLNKLDLSVIFVSNKKIKQLNKLYRKKDEVTDVLSFFYGPETNEGEIFICLPQAKRQAKFTRLSLKQELVQLLIHGFVHLAGYDHKNRQDYKTMKKVEGEIYVTYQDNIKKH